MIGAASDSIESDNRLRMIRKIKYRFPEKIALKSGI